MSATAAGVPNADKVLVPGDPALTVAMQEKYIGFLAWVLELRFSPQEQDQLRGYMVQHWKNRDAENIQSALEALRTAAEIDGIAAAEKDIYRQEMIKAVLPSMRENAASDSEVRWLLGLYEREHQALAAGEPPLTRRIAAARAEYLAFVLVNSGVLPGEPDRAFKDRMIQQLVAEYPGLSATRQEEISKAPWTWAALQAAWANLPEAEKQDYRQQWQQAAQQAMSDWQRRAVQAMKQSRQVMESLQGRAADAQQLAGAADQFDRLARELREDEENRELADSLAATSLSLRAASQPAPAASAGDADAALRDEMTDAQWAQYQRMSPEQQRDEKFRLIMQRANRQHSMSLWTGAHVMNNIYSMSGSSMRTTFNGFTP